MNWTPILLSLKVATITSLILLIIGLPLSYFISFTKRKINVFLETVISLPLVLPPTVLGFYLLIAFSPNSSIGHFFLHYLNIELLFSFTGIIIASIIFSLPFMVQALSLGMKSIPFSYIECSHSLGKNKWKTFYKVILPLIKTYIISGLVLTFAHTLGEFGVILMIGGNISDKTRVASIAIYNETEKMNYELANEYAIWMLIISFVLLLSANIYSSYSKIKY